LTDRVDWRYVKRFIMRVVVERIRVECDRLLVWRGVCMKKKIKRRQVSWSGGRGSGRTGYQGRMMQVGFN
jgi:hypothetical protein